MYVFGGTDGTSYNELWEYQVFAHSWTLLRSSPTSAPMLGVAGEEVSNIPGFSSILNVWMACRMRHMCRAEEWGQFWCGMNLPSLCIYMVDLVILRSLHHLIRSCYSNLLLSC